MTRTRQWIPLVAGALIGAAALAAPAKFVCRLTAKESGKCCCIQKEGKLLCKNTGKLLDRCCCTRK